MMDSIQEHTAGGQLHQQSAQKRQLTDMASSTTSSASYEPWSEENLRQVIQLWELSPQEEERLRDFQQRVQDIDHDYNDPHVLLRYMYAPQGYKHAERLFREMIAWRLEKKVDTILQEYQPNPLLMDYTPIAFLKDYDRDGDPIYVERGGAIDGQGLLQRFSKEELERHAIWLREMQSSGPWVEEYERRQQRCIRDITVIYDLQGLSSRHLNPQVLAWFQGHMAMTDAYYPGPIKRVIIIRAPAIFRAIWSIVKHFFPPMARNKMIFPGPNNYLDVLSEYMDLNVLPSCIYPQGQGETAPGMPKRMDGGRIPDHVGYGGQGYVSEYASNTTNNKVSTYGRTGSNKTPSTCSEMSMDEECLEATQAAATIITKQISDDATKQTLIPKGEFEEVEHSNNQVNVLWEGTTGIEVTDKEHLTESQNPIRF